MKYIKTIEYTPNGVIVTKTPRPENIQASGKPISWDLALFLMKKTSK